MKWDTRHGRTDPPCSLGCCWFGVGKVVRKKIGKKTQPGCPIPIHRLYLYLFWLFLDLTNYHHPKNHPPKHPTSVDQKPALEKATTLNLTFTRIGRWPFRRVFSTGGRFRHFWCSKPEGQRFHSDAKVTRCQSEDGPQSHQVKGRVTLPETNSSHLKIGFPKRKVVFQPSVFRG